MRHNNQTKETYSRMGKRSQEVQENKRLENALNFRPTKSYLMFELTTNNPITGIKNHIEIKHEVNNGNNRNNIYLNGERWRNNWSKTRFVNWLFKQIDNAINFE